jgi:hypothetical protein
MISSSDYLSSVGTFADPECLSWISDLIFSIPDPVSKVKKVRDPGSESATKKLSIFNPNIVTKLIKIQIRNFFHPGSRDQKTIGSGSPTVLFGIKLVRGKWLIMTSAYLHHDYASL